MGNNDIVHMNYWLYYLNQLLWVSSVVFLMVAYMKLENDSLFIDAW